MLFSSAELPSLVADRDDFHRLIPILSRRLDSITSITAPNTDRPYLDNICSLAMSMAKSSVQPPSMPAFIAICAAPSLTRHAFDLLNFYLPVPPLPPPPLLTPCPTAPHFSFPPYTATLHPGPPPILSLTLDPSSNTPPIILPATPTSLFALVSLLSAAHHAVLPPVTP